VNQYILLTIATLPSIYIGYYLLEADKKDRNNSLAYQLFFIGAGLAVPIYYLEIFLIESILQSTPFTTSFLVAGLIEEGVKLLMLIVVMLGVQEEVKSGNYILKKLDTYHYILLAVAISLGFATSENILYVFNRGASTGVLRAFTAVPMHACCGYLMGYVYSLKDRSTFEAFLLPFLIHGFYNFCQSSQEIPFLTAFVFIAVVIWGVIQLHKVVLVFHFSYKEKIKFSWNENLIKPGLGEIHTINSFNEKFIEVIIYFIVVCIGITIFFYTPLADIVINTIRGVLKFVLSLLNS
jgi:RsiW-degrading membrane proteinase PrsW (M82 family)